MGKGAEKSSEKMYSSQVDVCEQVLEYFEGENTESLVIEGFSGVGKSFTVEKIAELMRLKMERLEIFENNDLTRDVYSKLFVLDVDGDFGNIPSLKSQIRARALKAVFLRKPKIESGVVDSNSEKKEFVLSLKSLTDDEVGYYVHRLNPELNQEKVEKLKKYGYGIPYLISLMLKSDFSDENLMDFLRTYLNQQLLRYKNLSVEQLCEMVKDNTGRELLPELVREFEEAGGEVLIDKSLSDIHRITPQFVEFPVPVDLKTKNIYEQLLAGSNLVIDIYTDALEEEDLLKTLGFKEDMSYCKGRIELFGGTLRKTSANRMDNIFGYESRYGAHSGSGDGLPSQGKLSEAFGKYQRYYDSIAGEIKRHEPTLIETRAHEWQISNQVRVGYAVETYLQGKNLPYVVCYNNFVCKKAFLFNPGTTKIEEISGFEG